MGARTAERVARISDLSMNHQKNMHQIDLVNRDEEARRLKLRLLSLRDENAALKDRLSQKDSHIDVISRQGDDAQAELNEYREKIRLQDVKLKKQGNELGALKTELESLNGSIEDSSKALQEKFALNRELSRIRPEIEHLKSQLTNHQSVVAEKHELQRQLNSLEVELENEKRSKQRMLQKMDSDAGDELKARLAAAESDRKEWEKAKRKYESDLREAEGEREQLAERVSTMKLKLKGVQFELKETRDVLAKCRTELELAHKSSRTANAPQKKATTTKSQASRKRRIHDISMEDISIGTPGPDEATLKRPLKKRAADYALVGEKSTFSVTPFLSKTKNVSDESIEAISPVAKHGLVSEYVAEEDEATVDEEETQVSKPSPEPPKNPIESLESDAERSSSPKTQKPRGRPRKVLDDAPTLKKNMPSASSKKIKEFQVNAKLDMVEEEPEVSEQENGAGKKRTKGLGQKAKALESKSSNTSVMETDGRKKKRKILGASNKTLFDDDDAEIVPKQTKIQLGAGRKLKAPLGGVSNAFGGKTFSPLKRDRRGVGASFLV